MALPEWATLMYELLVFVVITIIYIMEAIFLTFVPQRYRAKSVKGEVALVTGGAGGVGSLIAKRLAKLGAHVVIWDINDTGMVDTVREIREAGGKCWSYHCDLADKEEVYKTAKTVQVEVGSVTLLINNAGYVWGKTLLNLPDNEIERTYRINILAHYWTTKAFLKDMMKNNHGHIVTVASVAGLLGTYKCTDYSATKFAAIGYHESLYTELKLSGTIIYYHNCQLPDCPLRQDSQVHGYDGIHATLVCPSYINTGMFEGVKPRTRMLEPEYVAEKVVTGILVNQVVVVIPEAVRFLLPLKFLLPAKSCWALMYNILGGPQSMMTMKEKSQIEVSRNNNNDSIMSNGACIK